LSRNNYREDYNMAAPVKVFPHTLEVGFTDKQWDAIAEIAHVTGASKAAVIRSFFNYGMARLNEVPMPEHMRDRFASVDSIVREEVSA
jgi:hypothetical protein